MADEQDTARNEMQSAESTLSALYARVSEGTDEEATEELDTFNYGVSTYVQLRVVLSGGGPATRLIVTAYPDWEVKSVEFEYAEWGNVVTLDVPEDSSLYTYAESLAELERDRESTGQGTY